MLGKKKQICFTSLSSELSLSYSLGLAHSEQLMYDFPVAKRFTYVFMLCFTSTRAVALL